MGAASSIDRRAATHTPGPWRANLRKDTPTFEILHSKSELRPNCVVGYVNKLLLDAQANARLIAAAPDLLGVCEFFEKYAVMRAAKGDPLPSQLLGSLDAALTKVRPEGGAA